MLLLAISALVVVGHYHGKEIAKCNQHWMEQWERGGCMMLGEWEGNELNPDIEMGYPPLYNNLSIEVDNNGN